jgi:hypothetical protein
MTYDDFIKKIYEFNLKELKIEPLKDEENINYVKCSAQTVYSIYKDLEIVPLEIYQAYEEDNQVYISTMGASCHEIIYYTNEDGVRVSKIKKQDRPCNICGMDFSIKSINNKIFLDLESAKVAFNNQKTIQ